MFCWGYFAVLGLSTVALITRRRGRWGFFWWVPATSGLLVLACYLVFVVDDGLPAQPGPTGGGEQLAYLTVNAARAVVIAALVACGLAFPRDPDRL